MGLLQAAPLLLSAAAACLAQGPLPRSWCRPSQVLSLRREKAELLGFKNFAEVSMASKASDRTGITQQLAFAAVKAGAARRAGRRRRPPLLLSTPPELLPKPQCGGL